MKNILIVIDMQRGFTQRKDTSILAERMAELLSLNKFDAVVATRFINGDNSTYEQLFNWKQLKGEEECELIDCVEEHADVVMDKYIYTGVNDNLIQKLCQLNDGMYPERVFVVGADTDCCVLVTATGLFERNIRPIVLTRYCASNGGGASHEAGLLCLKRLIDSRQLVDIEITESTSLADITA